MAEVRLDHVWKRFGSHDVVLDVDLAIHDQEFVVLLGPSGCGKTTTLRMLAGLEEISEGRVWIDGADVTRLAPKDRDIAMVFQNYALYPHMTVYENMAFGLKLRHTPPAVIAERVSQAAEMLGLAGYLGRKPKELSGGQRQRVALGRAIVREPKVFLMDEPLSNLDAKLRTQTRVELKGLHQRLGATVVYVTHDQTEAMTLATRIVVMRDGQVQQIDTPEGIYGRPTNAFVASFVGTPGMNLVECELTTQDGAIVAQAGRGFAVPLSASFRSLDVNRVVLGIRPEDIRIGRGSGGNESARGRVQLVEPMGHETMVYIDVGGTRLVAREDKTIAVVPGDHVVLTFSPAHLHFFDGVSGDRVTVADR